VLLLLAQNLLKSSTNEGLALSYLLVGEELYFRFGLFSYFLVGEELYLRFGLLFIVGLIIYY
jgi:hypothetical protein